MAQKHEPTPVNQKVLRLLRQAISTQDGAVLEGITHHLPVRPRGGGVPKTYIVCLAPDEHGAFVVTCRELPDLLIFGSTEEEALVNAEVVIREALADRRNSRGFLM